MGSSLGDDNVVPQPAGTRTTRYDVPMLLWSLLIACTSDGPSPDGGPATDAPTEASASSGDTGHTAVVPVDEPLEGWPIVPPSAAGLHAPFLARDDDTGFLYITWGERGTDGFTRIYAAVSTDEGLSFSTPQEVSQRLQDATASWPEGPVLAVGPDHLYLAYGAFELGGAPYTIFVMKAPLPRPPGGPTPAVVPLELEHAARIAQPVSFHSVNYPTLAIHPDGRAWIAMVASPAYDGRVWVAREAYGWAVEDVTASSPLSEPPCECCPPALGVDPSGRMLVGWRGDVDKDLFIAESNGTDPFTGHRKITDTDVSDLICPQGGEGFVSTEEATGWSHEPILTRWEGVQARVGVVVTDDGLLTHWDSGWGGDARMARPGSHHSQGIVVEGGGPLSEVRAVAAPSGPIAIGVDEARGLWMVRLAPSRR